MEQRLCEAAITGSVQSLYEIIAEDELILDKIVEGCFKKSPLHVAASRGHKKFVDELLRRSPELTEILDSRNRSALHLASAKGHLEIVKALITVNPEMCLASDRDGRNPLHIAALKGMVNILEELFHSSPHAALVKVDQVETILHLCVKYNQLKSLELLLKMINDPEFVNAKDGCGNHILHLAVLGRQFEIIEHVLMNKNIDANATNANGHTAMDILFLEQSGTDLKDLDVSIEDLLQKAKVERADKADLFQRAEVERANKALIPRERLIKKRGALMIVASLIATMAFQAGVNPPGGVWNDDSNGHRAGEAVMAYNYQGLYLHFVRSNTVGFIASLSTILLIISGFPSRIRIFKWILVVIMWLTITSMAFTYSFSIVVVTPKKDRKLVSNSIVVATIVWSSVMAYLLLVHTLRWILLWSMRKWVQTRSFKEFFKFGSSRGQQSARPHLVNV